MAHETTVRKEFTSFLAERDHSQHLLSEPVFLSKGSLQKIKRLSQKASQEESVQDCPRQVPENRISQHPVSRARENCDRKLGH